MGNRAGSIPALGTELWLNTIRDPVAHMNFRHALALPTERTPLALVGDPKSREIIKGQAGDLNIRYNSKQAKYPESSTKGGVCNDYRSCKRR